MIVQQKRCRNLNIYLRILFYFIFKWSVCPLISSTKSGPWPELECPRPGAVGCWCEAPRKSDARRGLNEACIGQTRTAKAQVHRTRNEIFCWISDIELRLVRDAMRGLTRMRGVVYLRCKAWPDSDARHRVTRVRGAAWMKRESTKHRLRKPKLTSIKPEVRKLTLNDHTRAAASLECEARPDSDARRRVTRKQCAAWLGREAMLSIAYYWYDQYQPWILQTKKCQWISQRKAIK